MPPGPGPGWGTGSSPGSAPAPSAAAGGAIPGSPPSPPAGSPRQPRQDLGAAASRTAGRIRFQSGARPAGLRPITIPGLLDGQAARGDGVQAVRPDESARTGTGTPPTAPEGYQLSPGRQPGETRYPTSVGVEGAEVPCACGRRNPPGTRFCPCGEMLVPLDPGPRRDGALADPDRSHGLRPTLAGAGQRRRFDREMRSAAGAWRGYDQPLAPRAVIFRSTALAVVATALLVLVGPWSGSSRAWASDRFAGLLPHSYREIRVGSVSVTPPEKDLSGFAPWNAVDGFRDHSWATAWHPERPIDPAADCPETSGRSATLVVHFDEQVRIDRVSVRAGLDGRDPTRLAQARPKRIGVQLGGGGCQILPLRDVADAQELAVHGRDVGFVKIWIVEAYDAASGPNNAVAISEIDFLRDR